MRQAYGISKLKCLLDAARNSNMDTRVVVVVGGVVVAAVAVVVGVVVVVGGVVVVAAAVVITIAVVGDDGGGGNVGAAVPFPCLIIAAVHVTPFGAT